MDRRNSRTDFAVVCFVAFVMLVVFFGGMGGVFMLSVAGP